MAAGDNERFAGYQVYDRHYEKIGKVEHLFVDQNDRLQYVGVKTGYFGNHSTLIPMDIVRVNDGRQLMEVDAEKSTITNSPTFENDRDLTPELEQRVYTNFGLKGPAGTSPDMGGHASHRGEENRRSSASGGSSVDAHYGERTAELYDLPIGVEGATPGREGASRDVADDRASSEARSGSDTNLHGDGSSEHANEQRQARKLVERGEEDPGMKTGDTETGEFRDHRRETEGVHQPASDLEDRDELRVQRSEEELRIGTRERAAGSVNVSKRVRTERERMRVPKQREEVTVERVPVSGVAADGEIGVNEEIQIPVVEEEIVVEKRAVVKEELRIRKDVVQGEEVVEEDLRKEEVDVYDETTRREDTGGGSAKRRDR